MISGVTRATAVIALGLAALTPIVGCSERALDVGLVESVMGEQPPAFPATPIRSMTGEKTEYPNLASVPPRPTDVRSPEERADDIRALEEQRAANRAASDALDRTNPALPQPAAVPPPPNLRPGG